MDHVSAKMATMETDVNMVRGWGWGAFAEIVADVVVVKLFKQVIVGINDIVADVVVEVVVVVINVIVWVVVLMCCGLQ